MLVIADSSPLIALVNIGHVDVLPKLFGRIVIPPEIVAELARRNRPQAVRDFVASAPAWLAVQAPQSVNPIPRLDPGECAAISLACELKADLLLIDETRGRRAATQRKLRLTGTVGILELAAARNLLDLRVAFDRLKETDFWISHKLLESRLRLYQSGGAG